MSRQAGRQAKVDAPLFVVTAPVHVRLLPTLPLLLLYITEEQRKGHPYCKQVTWEPTVLCCVDCVLSLSLLGTYVSAASSYETKTTPKGPIRHVANVR